MPKKSAKPKKEPIAKIEKTAAKFTFKGTDGKQYSMNMQKKLFCEKYLEFNGKGTQAYIAVYGPQKNGNTAHVAASQLLTTPNVVAYINSMLDSEGFNDQNVTKQHLFLINQHGDLANKSRGVDMFYKLRGQYAPDRIIHSIDEESIDAQLEDVRARKRALETETGGGGITSTQEKDSDR